MINIEYRHSAEPRDKTVRRPSVKTMSAYLKELVCDMQMEDVSAKLYDNEAPGRNMVYVNGRSVPEILEGLDIKMPEADEPESPVQMVKIEDRPTLEWNRDIIEDIPDILMKNAIAKVFAEAYDNTIQTL